MTGIKNDIERVDEISLMIYNKDIMVFAEIEKISKAKRFGISSLSIN